MQTAKEKLIFKHYSYDIELAPMGQKRLALTITDTTTNTQFYEKDLLLANIGVSTLIKAFQKQKKQINFTIDHKKGGQIQMLQIKFLVQSSFLKTVQQTLYIKKSRTVSDAQSLKKSIDYLNNKMKSLRANQLQEKRNTTYFQRNQKDNYYNGGNTFQTFSQITLNKGRYLVTWTFLAKATNQLMYIYLNSGQQTLLTNCAIYVPNMQNYIPYTYRKILNVNEDNYKLMLQTYCTASYPCSVRNAIVTARKLDK